MNQKDRKTIQLPEEEKNTMIRRSKITETEVNPVRGVKELVLSTLTEVNPVIEVDFLTENTPTVTGRIMLCILRVITF